MVRLKEMKLSLLQIKYLYIQKFQNNSQVNYVKQQGNLAGLQAQSHQSQSNCISENERQAEATLGTIKNSQKQWSGDTGNTLARAEVAGTEQ